MFERLRFSHRRLPIVLVAFLAGLLGADSLA